MIDYEKPLVSVILPVYNIEEYLPTCMESLFEQSYKNLEFVLVDDGSERSCSDLCDKYSGLDNRVVVYHKENGGLSDARNYGIKRAKGEWITCIDPDDYVDSDYVEYLFRLVKKFKTKMSICQHRVVKENRTTDFARPEGPEILSAKTCIERMLYHDVIDTSACAKLYHKSLFDSIEYPKGKYFEDIATTYKLLYKSKQIAVGYKSKYNYVRRDDSIVNSTFSTKKMDLLEMTDDMAQNVLSVYPDLGDAALRRQVYARFSTLNQMLGVKGYDKERNEIIRYIKRNSRKILKDKRAPGRDKIAIIALSISYRLYEKVWIAYKSH